MEAYVNSNQTVTNKPQEHKKEKVLSVRKLVVIALFSAISVILMLLDFSVPFAPSFLKLDISDLPAVLGGFMMGPVAGILIALLKNVLEILFRGTSTAFVGELANFAGAAVMVLASGLVYHFKKGKVGAAISLLVGTLLTTLAFTLIDYYVIFPMYVTLYGMPMKAIIGMGTAINPHITNLFTMMVWCVAPFNILKYGIVSVITFFTYKRLKNVLFR